MLKDLLELCLDGNRRIFVASDKDSGYTKKYKEEALTDNFIQFGNQYFTRVLSVDIDDTTDIYEIYERIDAISVPLPTFMVRTTKGWHLHWVLQHNVKQGGKAAYLRNLINDYLITLLGGDVRAKGFRRMWRNPLTHETIFRNTEHELKDFKHIIPDKIVKVYDKKDRPRAKRNKYIDWANIKVGERHDALFYAVSQMAYKLCKLPSDVLEVELMNFANYCNNLLSEPQSNLEIVRLVKSITVWVDKKYTGSSDRTKQFNKKLARHKSDTVKLKMLKSFMLLLTKMKTLKDIQSISVRKGGKLCNISKNTYHKYKQEVYNLLLELLLQNEVIDITFNFKDKSIEFNKTTLEDLLITFKDKPPSKGDT